MAIVAPIVDRLTASRRRLDGESIEYARAVYEASVDYERIWITRDSVFAAGAPRTIRNTVYLKSGWGHFIAQSTELSEFGRETLIHEMGHAWQYQHGGLAYIPKSLWAQLTAWLGKRTRDAAYDWRAAATAGIAWDRWNPEQQAEAMADYNRALRRPGNIGGRVPDDGTLALLEPFVQRVRRGEGAPTFGGPRGGRGRT